MADRDVSFLGLGQSLSQRLHRFTSQPNAIYVLLSPSARAPVSPLAATEYILTNVSVAWTNGYEAIAALVEPPPLERPVARVVDVDAHRATHFNRAGVSFLEKQARTTEILTVQRAGNSHRHRQFPGTIGQVTRFRR